MIKLNLKSLVVIAACGAAFWTAASCDEQETYTDFVLDWAEWSEGTDPDAPRDLPSDVPAEVCTPGERTCLGATSYQVCNADGTGWTEGGECGPNETCYAGQCLDPCAKADAERSSIGCVYYAVDTNAMQAASYAVALSNTNPTQTANVVIEANNAGMWTLVSTLSVTPLALQTQVLEHRNIEGSAIYQGGAYRITSDLPIIAYQFCPLDGSTSYLSDASLLLPRSGLDNYHIVAAWPQGPADDRTPEGYPAHIQIAAAAATEVRVTSSIATTPGTGVPALTPGVTTPFLLQEGDYLQLTVANHWDDFTGTYVESDGPVAVFSSNDCVNVPADINYCCCEHLEEQLFGLQTWGKIYMASRVPQRSAEPAVWRITASEDATTVTFNYDPVITGVPVGVTMNRGETVQYEVNGPFEQPGDFFIEADKPIHVMQYMVAAFMVSSGGNIGDPSMVQAVPVDQYLERYVVLVPTTWENDFFVLTRVTGSSVTVDGAEALTTWAAVGSSGYEVARVPVSDGVHVVEGDRAFGIIVIGYDSFDSYAYPGGLNLQIINPII
jgi:hypothetical protein